MISVYRQALGADFERLHPELQRRLDVNSASGFACIGQGIMDEIWRGPLVIVPFLYLVSWRRILFPDRGRKIPFRIENYGYVDSFGRETITWNRTFYLHKTRRFDATMIYSPRRRCIIDYLGSHQHLVTDIQAEVDAGGGLRLRSGATRFYEGPLAFPVPRFLTGFADVQEWFNDTTGRFHINVNVTNPIVGPLFGYHGAFTAEWPPSPHAPTAARPVREERRE